MTAAEFRLILDSRHRHIRTVSGRVREFADDRGFRARTVNAWYYGERPIPDYVARSLRPGKNGTPQLNAAVNLIAAELDRLSAHVSAVERMCVTCEPGGTCHDGKCPLRGVSPLRLSERRVA